MDEPAVGVTLSPATIKWVAGFLAAVFAAVVGYWQISDRVDQHWRLEAVQQARDKEAEAKEKQVHAEIAAVAKRAEVGRAWVMFNVVNGNATTHATLAKLCKAMRLAGDTCKDLDDEARGFKQDAVAAKASAQVAGKE